MEGMGTFELAGVGGDAVMRTAVNTRNIADPRWGGKVTGTLGRLTFATLSAGDEAPGRPTDDGPSPFPGDQKLFNIGRAVYSLGPNNYVGALVTDTEFGQGYNRVAGLDLSLRRGKQLLVGHRARHHEPNAGGRPGHERPRRPGLLCLREQAVPVREPARALRARLPDGHRLLEPDRGHGRLGLRGGELLPRREEAPLAEAHRPLRLLPGAPRRDPGRRRVVRPARDPDAFHAAGFLPRGHGVGAGALGAADLRDALHAVHGPGPDDPLAQPVVDLPVRAVHLLRSPRNRSSAARAPCPSQSRSSPARASTSPRPGTT